MAGERIRWDGAFPAIAASNVNDRQAVTWSASALERQVIPLATVNLEPFGIAGATAGPPVAGASSPNATLALAPACPVFDHGNLPKVQAAASLGAGADIGVASTNGGLGPVSGASGVVVFRVGKAMSPAAAGEWFSLYVSPRQLSGTP